MAFVSNDKIEELLLCSFLSLGLLLWSVLLQMLSQLESIMRSYCDVMTDTAKDLGESRSGRMPRRPVRNRDSRG